MSAGGAWAPVYLDNAATTGVRTIVSANPGCMMQLVAGLRERGEQVEVVHIMTLLDRAYAAASAPEIV